MQAQRGAGRLMALALTSKRFPASCWPCCVAWWIRAWQRSQRGQTRWGRPAAAACCCRLLLPCPPYPHPRPQKTPQNAAQGPPDPEWLAEVCINACLLLGRPEALAADVFPRWQPTPWLGALLQRLEPHILRDELPSLAPEVRKE